MRVLVAISLLVALTLTACTASLKTRMLRSSQIAETALGATQDAFYQACFGFVPTAATKPAVCTPASGISADLKKSIDGILSRAFDDQTKAVSAIDTWQPTAGGALPSSVTALQGEVNNFTLAVLQLAPGANHDAIAAKVNAWVAEVANLVKLFQGGTPA